MVMLYGHNPGNKNNLQVRQNDWTNLPSDVKCFSSYDSHAYCFTGPYFFCYHRGNH